MVPENLYRYTNDKRYEDAPDLMRSNHRGYKRQSKW